MEEEDEEHNLSRRSTGGKQKQSQDTSLQIISKSPMRSVFKQGRHQAKDLPLFQTEVNFTTALEINIG